MPADVLPLPGGHQVRFEQRGAGPDVLLLHGTLVTLEDMTLALGDSLAPHYRVTAIDRPGHGLSTRRRLTGSLRQQAKWIVGAIAALGLQRPLVVGHSAGAALSLAIALDHPAEIAGALSLAPIVLPELRLEQVLFGPRAVPILGDLVAHGPPRASDAALAPLLWNAMFLPQTMPADYAARFPFALAGASRDMQATGEEAVQQAADLAVNLVRYRANTVPTTIMNGDRDLVVNPAHGATLAFLMSRSRYRRLPGLGHMLHHFAQQAVLEELAALEERAKPAG